MCWNWSIKHRFVLYKITRGGIFDSGARSWGHTKMINDFRFAFSAILFFSFFLSFEMIQKKVEAYLGHRRAHTLPLDSRCSVNIFKFYSSPSHRKNQNAVVQSNCEAFIDACASLSTREPGEGQQWIFEVAKFDEFNERVAVAARKRNNSEMKAFFCA